MRILILTSRFPYPIEKGDKLRIYHAIKGLSENHEVHLYSIRTKKNNPKTWTHLDPFLTSYYLDTITLPGRIINASKTIFSKRLPLQSAWIFSDKIKSNLQQYAKSVNPDVVFVQLTRMAEHGRFLPYPKVLDYMDAFSVGMLKRAEISNFIWKQIYRIEAQRLKRYEGEVYHDFEKTCIISEQDKMKLSFDCESMEILSNGVDTSFFQPVESNPVYEVGFIGNLGYLPNIDAVNYLYHHIYQQKPGLRYLICGARPSAKILQYNQRNFKVTGWIPDIREAYQSIKVFIAPLFNGTGQQNKILEAMAMGIPCITSTEVNAGIGAIPDKEILIANSPREYQEKLSLLLNDQNWYLAIRKRALAFVINNFTWETHVKKLEELLKEAKEIYEYGRL